MILKIETITEKVNHIYVKLRCYEVVNNRGYNIVKKPETYARLQPRFKLSPGLIHIANIVSGFWPSCDNINLILKLISTTIGKILFQFVFPPKF